MALIKSPWHSDTPPEERKELRQLYWIWNAMKARCYNPNDPAYKNYGARGIKVCDRWLASWENFVIDMGPRAAGMMLERKENDQGYSPDNCQWSTRKQQNSNRRICIYVSDEGERVTLKEFCRRKTIKYRPFHKRLERGHTFEEALKMGGLNA